MTTTAEISTQVLTDRYTAVVRGELPGDQLPAWLARIFPTVHRYLRALGISPDGPPFARFTFLGDLVAVEAGFPVPGEIPGNGLVQASTLPDGQAAMITHTGPYEELDRAYQAVHDWLAAHGYESAGPHWEIYYTDPTTEPDPARWRTDVVVPYRVAARRSARR